MARVIGLVVVAIVVLVFPALICAKEYVVGDEDGWNTFVDYSAWAAGKTFSVGDILVFNYTKEDHNVIVVNATGYDQCISSPNSGAFYSGYDKITLKTSGDNYYICEYHCDYSGQKLTITVSSEKKKISAGVPLHSPLAAPHPSKLVSKPFWWKY